MIISPVVDISLSINDGNKVEVDEESNITISIEVVPSISSVDGLSAGLDSSIVVDINSVVNSSAGTYDVLRSVLSKYCIFSIEQ